MRLFLKICFTGIVLYILFRNVPLKDVLHLFSYIHYVWLAPAVLLFAASKFFSSIRLFEMFRSEHLFIHKAYNLYLYLLGMFYNFFLPGGIGGDGYKIYKIQKDYGYSYLLISKIIVSDRISGLIALCNLSAILYFCISDHTNKWLALVCALIADLLFYRIVQKKLSLPAGTVQTEVLSWMVQISQCICVYFILQALSIHEHIAIYLFIFLLSSVASLFPISIGGLGAREFTFLWGASTYPIEKEKAVCIGLLFYLISLLTSSFGGYFLFKPISKNTSYASL
ncbi:MAG: flippase-like domain-containing protein [Cytophagales bacterium]|nr:flippase-like domain-containing protein [Cytophaga sp.]